MPHRTMADRGQMPIMVVMSNSDARDRARSTEEQISGTMRNTEVPVHSTKKSNLAMVPIAIFMCLTQTSFAAARYGSSDPQYLWFMFSALAAIPSGFLLLVRDRHPEAVFWGSCAIVIIFPFDPTLTLMAMASLLARRSSRGITIGAIVAGGMTALISHLRDALNPPDASLWHMFFAKPNTGGNSGTPIVMLVGETPIIITAAVSALISTAIAALVGLHLRSKAIAASAEAKANAAASQAHTLQADLNNQQLADAIAAEAHDTLAHSLSLLALNASALQAESDKLRTMTQPGEDSIRIHADSIAQQAQQIRRQAAGALDEAHTIIDMLRHPEQAYVQLAPSDDTALTRESLDALITDARQAGMRIDTWIDIQQLSEMDENLGKIAYRTIQEGLTNARRHAPDAPVALQVDARPQTGVHIHISNPMAQHASSSSDRAGAGLQGIAARIHNAGGSCAYGADERGVFHIDARLPWTRTIAGEQTDVAGLA